MKIPMPGVWGTSFAISTRQLPVMLPLPAPAIAAAWAVEFTVAVQ